MYVVDAWTIYKLKQGEKAEIRFLLEFNRYICVSYLKPLSVAKNFESKLRWLPFKRR